jgi:hypothetical protein
MIKKAVKTVPELNGSPISFTKKTSKYPNNLSVDGSKSLKMNNNIETEKILASKNFLKLNFEKFLK